MSYEEIASSVSPPSFPNAFDSDPVTPDGSILVGTTIDPVASASSETMAIEDIVRELLEALERGAMNIEIRG